MGVLSILSSNLWLSTFNQLKMCSFILESCATIGRSTFTSCPAKSMAINGGLLGQPWTGRKIILQSLVILIRISPKQLNIYNVCL